MQTRLGLEAVGVDQAFIQSQLDTEKILKIDPWVWAVKVG